MNIQDLKRFAWKIQRGRFLPLLRATAESLVGEPVQVNLVRPIFDDALGHAYRTHKGLTIDLDPISNLDRFFFTFLHEVGHLHLGHCQDAEPIEDLIPAELTKMFQRRGVEMPQFFREKYEADQDGHEAQADNFARQIGEYARQKALDDLGSDSIKASLQILSNTQIRRRKNG